MRTPEMPSTAGFDLRHPAVAGYDVIADAFEAARKVKRWELPYFERLASLLKPGERLLDCGCGTGHVGLGSLVAAQVSVTALDGSAAMVAHFRRRYPDVPVVESDMLAYEPTEKLSAIIAWDSFFHLTHAEQARMIERFGAWLRPGGYLLFTSGPGHSAISGTMFEVPFAYASYSDAAYRDLLAASGFSVLLSDFDEPQAAIHKVWLARKT
jgi:trans-aconitate methyltransferase